MCKIYPVTFNDQTVGQAYVEKQGLYYYFQCSCSIPKESIYVIDIHCGHWQESLGVCIPKDNSFKVSKRIPMKRIPEGDLEFVVRAKERKDTTFVQLCDEAPFANFTQIEHALFCIRNGQRGLTFNHDSCHLKTKKIGRP